jgi:DNA-binding Xre family transcriptional regulator
MDDIHIGLNLKSILEQKRINTTEFAKAWGKSEQAVYDLYKKKDIQTSLLKNLAMILKVEITDLLRPTHQYIQNAKINSLGDGNVMQYGKTNHSSISNPDAEVKLLKEQLTSQIEQNKLLKEMVEILKSRDK